MHTENKIVTKKKENSNIGKSNDWKHSINPRKKHKGFSFVIVRNAASVPFPLSLIERVKQILIVIINELDIVFT